MVSVGFDAIDGRIDDVNQSYSARSLLSGCVGGRMMVVMDVALIHFDASAGDFLRCRTR